MSKRHATNVAHTHNESAAQMTDTSSNVTDVTDVTLDDDIANIPTSTPAANLAPTPAPAHVPSPGPRTPTPTLTAEEVAKSGSSIMLPGGERRIDYIRRRFYNDGAPRGLIAKELTKITGKPVPYQIVFSATKKQTAAQALQAQHAGESPAAALAAEEDEAHEAAQNEAFDGDVDVGVEELAE